MEFIVNIAYIILLFIFPLLFNKAFAQDSIVVEELEMVQFEISASKQRQHHRIYDLTARKNYVKSVIDISTHHNIGVYVPIVASNYISLQDIQFKIWNFKDNKEVAVDTSSNLYEVQLHTLSQLGNDTVITLSPSSVTYRKQQLTLHMNDIIPLKDSIKGFYVFIKFLSVSTVDDYFLVSFNKKYASSFTYWLDKAGNIKSFSFPLLEDNKHNAYLNKHRTRANFGVKIRYQSE